MKLRYPVVMEMINKTSGATPPRQLEAYLRKEALLRFVGKPGKVLDAGCGQGVMAVYLAQAGHEVTALDSGNEWVERTRSLAGPLAGAMHCTVGTIQETGLPAASYDLVMCEEALEHVEDPGMVLREFRRLLRPHGAVLISVPNTRSVRSLVIRALGREHLYNQKDHKQAFTAGSLGALLRSCGFVDLRLTSDIVAIPKVPVSMATAVWKWAAAVAPGIGHHVIAYARKGDRAEDHV